MDKAAHPDEVIMRGRIKNASGHIRCYTPNHPRAWDDRCMYEHIIIAERKIGRFLVEGEVVHHVNMDPGDNNPDNLLVCDYREHARLHDRGRKGVSVCLECNKTTHCIMTKGKLLCFNCYIKARYMEQPREKCSSCGKMRRLRSKKRMMCAYCERKVQG